MVASVLGGAGSPTWEELLGSDHWEGLLSPLDQSLRLFLLQLGDFQTITDAYITDEQSKKYAGSCRYAVDTLFQKTFFLHAADYSVDSFLYFNAQSIFEGRRANHWNGYVAISTDSHAAATGRREIYIVLRGIEGSMEAHNSLHFIPVPFDPAEEDVKVMAGWKEFYTTKVEAKSLKSSLREQLHQKIKDLVDRYRSDKLSVVCVGLSMGGALAILSAYDIVNSGLSQVDGQHFPVAAVTFGSPRVGNSAFDDRLKKLQGLRVLRVTNANDVVPCLPLSLPPLLEYVDNGENLEVASEKSPDLKTGHDLHNLEVMLHAVSGWEGGAGGSFDASKGGRDLVLVNKHSDFLLDTYQVQSTWWVEKNKGSVLRDDGKWYETPPEDSTLIDS